MGRIESLLICINVGIRDGGSYGITDIDIIIKAMKTTTMAEEEEERDEKEREGGYWSIGTGNGGKRSSSRRGGLLEPAL